MLNRAREPTHMNRFLILFYACLAVFSVYVSVINLRLIFSKPRDLEQEKRNLQNDSLNASPTGDYPETGKEFTVVWDGPRTPEELESMKYEPEDAVLQAKPFQHGYRFGFVPTEAEMMTSDNYTSEDYNRISIRFDLEITSGRTMSRVFVGIKEIDKSEEGIPYSGFHYKNLSPMSGSHKSMEIPIPPAMMDRWMTKESAEIGFILKFEFGFLSNVKKVTAKLPVLVFSNTTRPKCGEHSCCLTAYKEVKLTGRLVYKNLIQPESANHQRCIECIRTSEDYEPDLANFGMFLHDKLKIEDVPRPSQLGRCRATDWSPLQTIFKTKDDMVSQVNFPFFSAESCECVEDEDISPDYIDVQQRHDHRVRIDKLRSKKTTNNPPINP